MAAKTQNTIPPVFPLGSTTSPTGYGAATVFPMGETGAGADLPAGIALRVVGAGTAHVNGDYAEDGTNDGKPVYRLNGETVGHRVLWRASPPLWYIESGNDSAYINTADTPAPPAAGWTAFNVGIAPAPALIFP